MENNKLQGKIFLVVGLMLFVLVLIGVYLLDYLVGHYPKIEFIAPIIVLTGFFTFLISAGLFVYGIYILIRKE
jgi:high-affinity Fe2+/Pb2+ permease